LYLSARNLLVVIVAALVVFGMTMLVSSSSVRGLQTRFQDPLFYCKRQAVWLGLSLVLASAAARTDYHVLLRWAKPLCIAAVILLVAVLVPPFRREINGSCRWLTFGPFQFQASELGKFAMLVGLSAWLDSRMRQVRHFRRGVLAPMAGVGLLALLLLLEPDLGTTCLVGATSLAMLYSAGARLWHVAGMAGMGAAGLAVFLALNETRRNRFLSFLRPEDFPAYAYQLIESLKAFIVGGMWGVGLGESMQKQLYLPEPHTDFIFAIIGEELGFLATISVVLLFLGFALCGLRICVKAPDSFGRMLAFGITVMLAVQATINIGVVIGRLPTKGLPLPFISYGGSSLMMALVGVGVLFNIATHAQYPDLDPHTCPVRDAQRRV
jgi:cell division protein FtsW